MPKKGLDMKHYIIGGDGFVGRHLASELLSRDQEVVICDIAKSDLDVYEKASHVQLDITDPSAFDAISLQPDDIVYHMAARMLIPILPRAQRKDYLWSVNYHGTENLFAHCHKQGCYQIVYFTTDMIYGHSKLETRDEEHPKEPLGPYGGSKLASEELCETYREKGLNITIFRPRLIIGPGRLELLARMFKLVRANLPVPLIGSGANRFPFVSVYDCVEACLLAVEKGFPNRAYNVATLDPPTTAALIKHLIREVGSKSFLLPTPAWMTKGTLTALDYLGMPLMDPEQYLVADEHCVLDVSRAEAELGWKPRYKDEEMLVSAYEEYLNVIGKAA